MKKSTKIIVSVLAVVLIAGGIFGYQYIQNQNAKQAALEQELAQLKAEQEKQQPEMQQPEEQESENTASPVETTPAVTNNALTDEELQLIFNKVYVAFVTENPFGLADGELFNLKEVLELQNKTYPSDYEEKYVAWRPVFEMPVEEQPTENNYTNSETVTTDPDDEINNNFQQSGVDTSYSETEDTGTVPDLSGLGLDSSDNVDYNISGSDSVGDLDDTGLVINP